MDEDGDVAGGRSVGVCVDYIVDVDSSRCGEEGVPEVGQRFAVEAPVLLLGWNVSVASAVLLQGERRTNLELLLLFVRVCRLEDAVGPRDSDPGEAEAEEAETKLEDKPGQGRQPATGPFLREGRRRRHCR